MSENFSDAVSWLQSEFTRRKERRRSFSLRAFSRVLDIPPGPLSEILARKRALSAERGKTICRRLNFSEGETSQFMSMLKRSSKHHEAASETRRLEKFVDPYRTLRRDEFAKIADWYHFAILSLMETGDFKSSAAWIAKRLGITVADAREAMSRLLAQGLVRREGKRWMLNQAGVTTTTNVPCSSLRDSHRQSIRNSLKALEDVSVKDCEIASITMAIDPAKIEQAKKLCTNFRRLLASLLETGNRTEVYELNLQLVPVTQLRKSNAAAD